MSGSHYLYVGSRGELSKVGMSGDPARRARDLSNANDVFRLVETWAVRDRSTAAELERLVCQAFLASRAPRSYEWFVVPTSDLVEFIEATFTLPDGTIGLPLGHSLVPSRRRQWGGYPVPPRLAGTSEDLCIDRGLLHASTCDRSGTGEPVVRVDFLRDLPLDRLGDAIPAGCEWHCGETARLQWALESADRLLADLSEPFPEVAGDVGLALSTILEGVRATELRAVRESFEIWSDHPIFEEVSRAASARSEAARRRLDLVREEALRGTNPWLALPAAIWMIDLRRTRSQLPADLGAGFGFRYSEWAEEVSRSMNGRSTPLDTGGMMDSRSVEAAEAQCEAFVANALETVRIRPRSEELAFIALECGKLDFSERTPLRLDTPELDATSGRFATFLYPWSATDRHTVVVAVPSSFLFKMPDKWRQRGELPAGIADRPQHDQDRVVVPWWFSRGRVSFRYPELGRVLEFASRKEMPSAGAERFAWAIERCSELGKSQR